MEPKKLVNIDFNKIRTTFRDYVRTKAMEACSTIVYVSNGQLVEEDPKNNKITILQEVFSAK